MMKSWQQRAAMLLLLCPLAVQGQSPAPADYEPLRDAARAPAAMRIAVRIDLRSVPLEAALRQIVDSAHLGLSYRPGLDGLDRKVSLPATSMSAAEALLRVLQNSGLELLVAANGRTLMVRSAPRTTTHGSIAGTVRDDAGAPLAATDVRVAGTSLRGLADAEGRFLIDRVLPGRYLLEASRLGFQSRRDSVTVAANEKSSLDIALSVLAIPLTDVIVTPGHFGIAYETLSKPQTLTREQIEIMPQLGEDIYRAINRLPGIGSNEMTAKFNVRGGDDESLLVRLDGLELYEPYHLKDFDGSLSILDVAAIGAVDLTTGGFSAESGNRMTGVFDMRTASRITPRPRSSIGLSVSNLRFMSQGSFASDNGLWLFSARRGYLDYLLKLAGRGDNLDPTYYDGLAKVVYQLSPQHRVALHVLRAGDSAKFIDDDGVGTLHSGYGSTYAWGTWNADLGRGLEVETLVSAGKLDWNRRSSELEPGNGYNITDHRDLTFGGIKQDWQLALSDRALLKWGVEARRLGASYDYYRDRYGTGLEDGVATLQYDTSHIAVAPETDQVGAYLSQRSRPWQPLTIETGIRWDRQSLTSESQVSPRVNAALALDVSTTLRLAWGRYAQPHALHRLNVQDGVSEFEGAEKATQIVAGIERSFGNGFYARVETYRRNETDLRDRYRNFYSTIEPIAEIEGDRVRIPAERGRAEGVELLLQHTAPRSSWAVSYGLARAEDGIGDVWVPRPLDQRHTVYADYAVSPGRNWRISTSWQFHTGWPVTPTEWTADTLRNGNVWFLRTPGRYNSERLPAYHRLDLRVTRSFDVKQGRLAVFLDVFNLYDRDNPQSYNYSLRLIQGRLDVETTFEPLLPRMPTIGLTWEF